MPAADVARRLQSRLVRRGGRAPSLVLVEEPALVDLLLPVETRFHGVPGLVARVVAEEERDGLAVVVVVLRRAVVALDVVAVDVLHGESQVAVVAEPRLGGQVPVALAAVARLEEMEPVAAAQVVPVAGGHAEEEAQVRRRTVHLRAYCAGVRGR